MADISYIETTKSKLDSINILSGQRIICTDTGEEYYDSIDGDRIFIGKSIKDNISQLSNPNLLINGDFQINQRGQQTYTKSGGYIYTVDRWNCWSDNGKTNTIQKQDDGILCTLDGECRIRQAIERPSQMQNQYVTLSFEGSVTQGVCWASILTTDSIGDYAQGVTLGGVDFNGNEKRLTTKVTQLKKYLVVDFYAQEPSIIKLKWVKLELGSVATPFVPRLYGEELALCQRYFQKLDFTSVNTNNYGDCLYTIPLRVEMRVDPTVNIKLNDVYTIGAWDSNAYTNVTNFDLDYSTTSIRIRCTRPKEGIVNYDFRGTFDAEIY